MRTGDVARYLASFCVCAAAWGQTIGTINGMVTDPSGAVIPGAPITATEMETSIARTAIGNASGLS